MAKGSFLTPEVRNLIAQIYLEHPGYGPTKIREELLNRIKEADLIGTYDSDWPGVSAVGKVVAEIRKRDSARPPKLRGLDSPWSFGCLAQYDIPPEALPKVMSIYQKRLATLEQRFTIRQALWIARLHKVIDDLIPLERFAFVYALRDWIDSVLDNPVYTRGLDITLMRYLDGEIPVTEIGKGYALPSWGREEEEELEKNLRKKGYTLGIALTEKEAEQNERINSTKK